MKALRFFIFGIVATLVISCDGKKQSTDIQNVNATIFADTIRYNVEMTPSDPTDDYAAECIARLQKTQLLDSIFASIYQHGARVTRYSNGKEISLDELKTLEIEDERYARENVSVLQFTETWSYDAKALIFNKKVISIHIAYALRDDDGYIVANRAGFVVQLNSTY